MTLGLAGFLVKVCTPSAEEASTSKAWRDQMEATEKELPSASRLLNVSSVC